MGCADQGKRRQRRLTPAGHHPASSATRGSLTTNSVKLPGTLSNAMLAAVLLDDDVVGERQAEPRALARGLGCEERREQAIAQFERYSVAVVADLHGDVGFGASGR